MNILSFDIEEWFIEKTYCGGRRARYDAFDNCLSKILDLLDECHLKATFFVVGMMGKDFPEVVKRIKESGHEIGCHSNCHTWLNKMNREEVLEDTRMAIDLLEQCIGDKVKCYRAPSFSISNNNSWVFEILIQCGIENDASVFPSSMDFGGFPDFGPQQPTLIQTPVGTIMEYPVALAHLLGKDIAFSGGGYFRLLPLWLVNRLMSKQDYNVCYFHIGDLVPSGAKLMTRQWYEDYYKEPGTIINRYKRHIKTNIGKSTAFERMCRLIRSHGFISITQASELIDWSTSPRITTK